MRAAFSSLPELVPSRKFRLFPNRAEVCHFMAVGRLWTVPGPVI